MKKAVLLFGLLWIICIQAQAQPSKEFMENARKHIAGYGPAFATAPALKTATMQERVVAQVLVGIDSLVFHYSGNHYSMFDYNLMRYINDDYAGGADYTPLDLVFILPPLNAHDTMQQLVNFDSLTCYTAYDENANRVTPIFVGNVLVYHYNADGTISNTNCDGYDKYHVPTGTYRQVAVYNGSKLAKVYAINKTDTIYVRTITYTSNDRIVTDSYSIIQYQQRRMAPACRSTYTYDASDKWLVKFQEVLYSPGSCARLTNTYNADGRLHTATHEVTSNGIWGYGPKDSFSYTPGVPGYTGFYEFFYHVDGTVANTYKEVCQHINAQQLKDSVLVTVLYDTIVNSFVAWKYDYDAMGNPISMKVYNLLSSPVTVGDSYRWYYEPNTSNVGIASPRNSLLYKGSFLKQ